MAGNFIRVDGIDDIENILSDLVPRHARNIMRATIGGVARDIANDIKATAPKRTGILKRSIKTKRPRQKPDKIRMNVVATRGAGAKSDGFYWKFVEFGTAGNNPQSPKPFVGPARERGNSNMQTLIRTQFRVKLRKAAEREQKRKAKKAN